MGDDRITVKIRPETREALDRLKRGDETYDEVIRRVLSGQGYDVDIVAPKSEIYGSEVAAWLDILEAVKDIKPPTKYREMLVWFALSLLGGIGLGLFLVLR